MGVPPAEDHPLAAAEQGVAAYCAAAGQGPLLVAVSGGGDSLALLALVRAAAGTRPVTALVIDHAVQEGSAAVAQQAADRAEAMGARALIRRIAWPGGSALRDQASAREARYRALAAMGREAGGAVIAVAHTRDDQAETALIKRVRTGRWGEAGMTAYAPLPVWPEGCGLWLARPLLTTARAALRVYLTDLGLSWHEDRANAHPAFLRARVRAALAAPGAPVARLAAHAAQAAALAVARNAAALAWLEAEMEEDGAGGLWLPGPPTTQRAQRRAFSAAIGAVAGFPNAAGPERLSRLLTQLETSAAATVAGALVRRRRGRLHLRRDPGALLGRAGVPGFASIPLPPGQEVTVDGRLALQAASEGWQICVSPKAELGLRRAGHWIALNEAPDVTYRWLTRTHLRHVLHAGRLPPPATPGRVFSRL